MKKIFNSLSFLFAALFLLALSNEGFAAQKIVYVPFDDRPVSLECSVKTLQAAGVEIVAPPVEMLASRGRSAKPEELWQWVAGEAATADALVLSQDAMIYGGLVASRTHDFTFEQLQARLDNYRKMTQQYPALRIYLFSTIMRSPHASSGGVEPPYYEQYGPDIFSLYALTDKAETEKLTEEEAKTLAYVSNSVPQEIQKDWLERREKNYRVNTQTIKLLRDGAFAYMILGRDDCSPYSRSHQEARWLKKETADLALNKYATFPGADQLGMLMLTRAVNDMNFKMPSVSVFYADGVGAKTIPSYEDTPVGENVWNHLWAAGCLPLQYSDKADLTLAVNTPYDGWTREAGRPDNIKEASLAVRNFAQRVSADVRNEKKVILGDIAFANGADNALMNLLAKQGTLNGLQAYSGWNTASNTLGFAIGQGVLAERMSPEGRHSLLTVRFLDDWAYQANVRQSLLKNVLEPVGHSDVLLNELRTSLAIQATKELAAFAAKEMPEWKTEPFAAEFPWNRMFEVRIRLEK